MVRHQAHTLAAHEQKLAAQQRELSTVHEQLRLLLAQRFGASSERVSEAQLGLFNEAEQEAEHAHDGDDDETMSPDTIEVPAHERARPKRQPLPKDLPRVDVVHDLDASDKVCPHDGTALKCIGSEDTEQFDIVPAKVQVLRHQRLKYVCPCCDKHIVTAPMTAQPIPKSQASPGLLAFVATAKYIDGLPLHRQVAQFKRLGFERSTATLSRWMIKSGALSQPLVNLLREELVSQHYVHMDETTVQVLNEAGKAAQSTSYMWAQCSGLPERPIVLFDYDASRSGQVPLRLLEGFKGYLHTDAYAGYNAVIKAQGLTQVLCMAHARRYFTDALKADGINPKKLPLKPGKSARWAIKALGFIKTLYIIERRIRDEPPDARYRIRQSDSIPILDKFKRWLDDNYAKVSTETKLGTALHYAHNNWQGLIRYCEDGRLNIDNNPIENAIRPFCVGRRSWLFSNSVDGAKASANLYSLIATAKANGLEPYAYLRYVFTHLPQATCVEDIEALLPYQLQSSDLLQDLTTSP